jgi:hypothetical protein
MFRENGSPAHHCRFENEPRKVSEKDGRSAINEEKDSA